MSIIVFSDITKHKTYYKQKLQEYDKEFMSLKNQGMHTYDDSFNYAAWVCHTAVCCASTSWDNKCKQYLGFLSYIRRVHYSSIGTRKERI